MFHYLQLALYRDNMQSMLEKVENITKELKNKDILLEKAEVRVMEAKELVKQLSWASMEMAIPTQPYLREQSTQSSQASMETAIPTQPYSREQSTQSSQASVETAIPTQPYLREQSTQSSWLAWKQPHPHNLTCRSSCQPSCSMFLLVIPPRFHSVIQLGMRMRTCIWVIMKQVN